MTAPGSVYLVFKFQLNYMTKIHGLFVPMMLGLTLLGSCKKDSGGGGGVPLLPW
jgi:hypothetical protein